MPLSETVRAYVDGLALLRDGLRRVTISRQSMEADLAARSDAAGIIATAPAAAAAKDSPIIVAAKKAATDAKR